MAQGEGMTVTGPTADRPLLAYPTRKRTFGHSAPRSGNGPKPSLIIALQAIILDVSLSVERLLCSLSLQHFSSLCVSAAHSVEEMKMRALVAGRYQASHERVGLPV